MPPEVALNMPAWFVFVFVVSLVALYLATRKDADGIVEPIHGLAHEAVPEEVGADLQCAARRDENPRAAARTLVKRECQCPSCLSHRAIVAHGVAWIDGRWVSLN